MLDQTKLATESKAIVAPAFRNGPIKDLHAGQPCLTCRANPRYSRISDAEMKQIMKAAVDRVYSLLLLREKDVGKTSADCVSGGRACFIAAGKRMGRALQFADNITVYQATSSFFETRIGLNSATSNATCCRNSGRMLVYATRIRNCAAWEL
jgi:hypothetical protein